MIPDLLDPDQIVVFVGTAVTELDEALGFPHLHSRDRFWELLMIGGITPTRLITSSEAKALDEGHRSGNLTDPVRLLFIEKKVGQLRRLQIGITDLNRRIAVPSERDPGAKPLESDLDEFLARMAVNSPRILAFVTLPEIFVGAFTKRFPEANDAVGRQSARIGGVETWFLGSGMSRPRKEAATQQEDAFFALGERIRELRGS